MGLARRAFSAVILAASIAHAGDPAHDKALAEALFQEGRDLLDRGRIPDACVKFAASQRLEAKLGTLLNLAACHEAEGKVASAWAEFIEAQTQAEHAHQPDRAQYAKEHVDALAPKLSRVTIALADLAPNIVVKLDGSTLERSIVGTPLPLDPGDHAIAVSADGKRTWSSNITVEQGPWEKKLDVPALEDEPPPPVIVTPPPLQPIPVVVHQDTTISRPAMIAGWISVGVAALGIGIGSYAGLRAFGLNSDGERQCMGMTCSQSGLDTINDARTHAAVSTVAFTIGAVALAAAAYFFFLSPRVTRR